MSRELKRIGVIGLGLIGGSLAKDFRSRRIASDIIGHDKSQSHQARALELGIVQTVGTIEHVVENSDVIFVSIPVSAMLEVIPKLLDQIDHQLIVEVGSTKAKLLNKIADHPKRRQLASLHPMAGTEYTGPDAALYHLFDQKCCVICDPDDTHADYLKLARNLIERVGMYCIQMDRENHDLHAAYVSHISHITSFALAHTVLQKEKDESRIFELASAGFSSTVRLAKSSPAMWAPIFMQNKENVLDVLNEHIYQLNYFKKCLEEDSGQKLFHWMEQANQIRKIIN